MVALGSATGGPTNNVEIIDLKSSETSCSNFPAYPFVADRAKGDLGFQEAPLICGGGYPTVPKKSATPLKMEHGGPLGQ